MLFIPKNRTYTSEKYLKTIVLPITILVLCAGFVAVFNPFTQPQVASIFGIETKTSFVVQSIRQFDIQGPSRSGWNCDYWFAYGSTEGRKISTRACNKDISPPQNRDVLEVLTAPNGEEAYLLARGNPANIATKSVAFLFALLILYGLVLSLRLLYIGYRSNWFKSQ